MKRGAEEGAGERLSLGGLSLLEDAHPLAALVQLVEWYCVRGVGTRDTLFSAGTLCSLSSSCKAIRSITEASPQFWAHLDLSRLKQPTSFLDPLVMQHPRFREVSSLNLQFCDAVADNHLAALPPMLCELNLDACHGVTDKGVKNAAQACGARLQVLSLYWNMKVTNAALLTLALRCGPSLTSLCLSGCQQIESTGIFSLASRCRSLTALDLTRVPRVEDAALAAIVQANPNLRKLCLFAASQYSDAPIHALARYCPQLRHLDCSGLRRLTDESICALSNGCHELRALLLSWVVELTDDAVVALSCGCPRLATLSLHGIRGVSSKGLAALAERLAPSIVELDVRGCLHLGDLRTTEELRVCFPRLTNVVLQK